MVSRGELCSVINAEVNKVFAEFSPVFAAWPIFPWEPAGGRRWPRFESH